MNVGLSFLCHVEVPEHNKQKNCFVAADFFKMMAFLKPGACITHSAT